MDALLKPQQNPRVYLPAYGLWLLTTILSVFTFIAGRETMIRTYTRFFPGEVIRFQAGAGGISLINILISFPLAMFVIAVVIGGFEYQHRYMGSPEGWRLLARIFALEFGILLLALYI